MEVIMCDLTLHQFHGLGSEEVEPPSMLGICHCCFPECPEPPSSFEGDRSLAVL